MSDHNYTLKSGWLEDLLRRRANGESIYPIDYAFALYLLEFNDENSNLFERSYIRAELEFHLNHGANTSEHNSTSRNKKNSLGELTSAVIQGFEQIERQIQIFGDQISSYHEEKLFLEKNRQAGNVLELLGEVDKTIGRALRQNGDEKEISLRTALQSLEDCLTYPICKSKPWAWIRRGWLEGYQLEDYDKAVMSFKQALAHSFDDRELYIFTSRHIADIRCKQGKFEEALEELARHKEVPRSQRAVLLFEKARYASLCGRTTLAEDTIEESMNACPIYALLAEGESDFAFTSIDIHSIISDKITIARQKLSAYDHVTKRALELRRQISKVSDCTETRALEFASDLMEYPAINETTRFEGAVGYYLLENQVSAAYTYLCRQGRTRAQDDALCLRIGEYVSAALQSTVPDSVILHDSAKSVERLQNEISNLNNPFDLSRAKLKSLVRKQREVLALGVFTWISTVSVYGLFHVWCYVDKGTANDPSGFQPLAFFVLLGAAFYALAKEIDSFFPSCLWFSLFVFMVFVSASSSQNPSVFGPFLLYFYALLATLFFVVTVVALVSETREIEFRLIFAPAKWQLSEQAAYVATRKRLENSLQEAQMAFAAVNARERNRLEAVETIVNFAKSLCSEVRSTRFAIPSKGIIGSWRNV